MLWCAVIPCCELVVEMAVVASVGHLFLACNGICDTLMQFLLVHTRTCALSITISSPLRQFRRPGLRLLLSPCW
jgi:hypothetical protein